MRVAIGGIMHESNTFSPTPTDSSAFDVQRGREVLDVWRGTHHEMGGFIEGAAQFGYEPVPTLMAWATPSGKVTTSAFDLLVSELIMRLQAALPLDGILLALHGAMVVDIYPDGDGEILRRLREAIGNALPIVVTLDFHANVSEAMVKSATATVIYQTNPHVDQRETGLKAASILARTLRGEIRPVQALAQPLMLLNIVHQHTNAEPVQSIMQAARTVEAQPGVLAASIAAGYQYADVYKMGASVVVVADNVVETAQREAQNLCDLLRNTRAQLVLQAVTIPEAVRQAARSKQTPVVLVDMGDNIGGGSPGDSTFILSELLRQQVDGWVIVLTDPEAAQYCARAGIGAAVTLRVGGKTDMLHGEPVKISGRVKCLHDGVYEETEARHSGRRHFNQGLTALLEIGASTPEWTSYLVLASVRQMPVSLQQLLSVGIQPQRQRVLVAKAVHSHRAAYEPIAARMIPVDTPGLTAVNPDHFQYRHLNPMLWTGVEMANVLD